MFGDSRVVKLREVCYQTAGWDVYYRLKAGAKMDEIKDMVIEVAEGNQAKPEVVIIVGLYADTCKKVRDQFGVRLTIKEGVMNSGNRVYPHVAGVPDLVRSLNDCIEELWRGVQIFWTTPAPIDFCRHNQV